jgi:hypothetical protein
MSHFAALLLAVPALGDTTAPPKSFGSEGIPVSADPKEQLGLLDNLIKSDNPAAKKLLAEIGVGSKRKKGGKSLVWWGTMQDIKGPPIRVYLFDLWVRSVPPSESSVVCVVTDEERRLLVWRALADGELGILSVETFLFESPAQFAIRVRTTSGIVRYRYIVSDKNIRETGHSPGENGTKHIGVGP